MQAVFDPDTTKGLMENLKKGVYTLRDMSEMFKSVAKLGSMSQVGRWGGGIQKQWCAFLWTASCAGDSGG